MSEVGHGTEAVPSGGGRGAEAGGGTEDKVAQLRCRLEDLIRLVSDWVWETDADFRFTYASPRVLDVLGFPPPALRGRTFSDFGSFRSEDGVPFAFDRGRPFRNVLFNASTASGRERFLLVSGLPVFDFRSGAFTGMRGTAEDVTERHFAEQRTRAALDEKEALLREIHHRVKNNMQVVNSLLRLQARQIENAAVREALNGCRDRISAMSLIHETLYKSSSLARIDFRDYVENLLVSLWLAFDARAEAITWRADVAPISLALDEAVPVGLIVNELVSNSIKHAFPCGGGGRIEVGLWEEPAGMAELVVADDGVGLDPLVFDRPARGLGLRLMLTLAQDQLGGVVSLDGRSGTRVSVRFPLRNRNG